MSDPTPTTTTTTTAPATSTTSSATAAAALLDANNDNNDNNEDKEQFKNHLLRRMGGRAEYEMVLSCYIDNLLKDEELNTRFFRFEPVTTLMEQQEKVLDVILAKDPEHAMIRVAFYFKDLTERGFRREHFLRFRDHFLDALRENWEDELVLAEVKESFKDYIAIFDNHNHDYCYNAPSSSSSSSAGAVSDLHTAKKSKSKRKQEAAASITSTPETEPKRSITAAIQHTPDRIRALKNKLTTRRHPMMGSGSGSGTAAAQERNNNNNNVATTTTTTTTTPTSDGETTPSSQKKKQSLRNGMANLLVPADL
jgi:CCR4-NOT transcriptional regulation complex NOT5 subunit